MTVPIKLKIPHEKPFHGIARLVVGGLAARLDLSYEHLEDLQLALSSVLEHDGYIALSEVTVELSVDEGVLQMLIGPLGGDELRADLERETDDGITLRRLLGTVAERVEVVKRDDEEWLRLEKRIHAVPAEV